ncbi:MAG: ComEC/Rec2 family competence protein [Henriciella sp.]|nr:ComEC/Rec2 family competence protein [Henriciella sp.]
MRRFPSSLLQFTSRERLPSYFALGMLVGAIIYFSIDFEPPFAALVLISVISGGCVWLSASFARSTGVFAVALVAFSAALGALAGGAATQLLSHTQIASPTGPVLVEGWVTAVQPAKRGVRVVLRVHAIDQLPAEQTPELVRLTHIARFETEPGRFVRCWAVLRPPPMPVIEGDYPFNRQAWYRGLGGVGYIQGRCQGGALGPPTGWLRSSELRVGKARRQLARHVRTKAGERAGGLAAALASGDRSYLSAADQDALRGAGLAHLLAISGLHIGIVGGLVFVIVWRGLALIEPIALRWPVKKPAAAAAIFICGLYLIISGASVSTQRAFAMAVIFFGAVLVDRAALTQRSLAIAMMVIIILAPWSVLSPGFQMSFAATLVLISTYESWQRRREQSAIASRGLGFWLKSLLITSGVTSLATMPFALYHFDRVAGMGVIANVSAMPIISLFSAPLAAMALMLAPLGLDGLALRGFGLSLEWILAIAHAASGWRLLDGVRLPQLPAISLALFASTLITGCVFDVGRTRTYSAIAFALLAFVFWAASPRDRLHWAPSGDVYLEQGWGEVQRVAFVDGSGLGPLRFSDLAIDAACRTEKGCRLRLRDQQVLLVPDAASISCVEYEAADIILSRSRLEACSQFAASNLVLWAAVIRENGITLERRGGALVKREKLACDSRPWCRC